jgi:hypothetical protein
MARTRSLPLLAVAILGGTLCGCLGGSGPKITGAVTMDGEPLADAQVHFYSVATNTPVAIAKTGADGKFQVQPRARSGETINPGKYAVRITRFVDKAGKVPSDQDLGQLQMSGQLRNTVPPMYSDRSLPGFPVEIKPGTNELPPFELKSK